MTLGDFLTRLDGVRDAGGYHKARCPAHEDDHASLSVKEGRKGIVLKCHAGCSVKEILAKMRLSAADLFFEPLKLDATRNGARPAKQQPLGRIVETYDYTDTEGRLLFQSVRYDPKTFRQRRPDDCGGWIKNLEGVSPVLYRLPTVQQGVAARRTIFVVEGEKDVHTLEKLGQVATTNPMGAGAWQDSFAHPLTGARVVILTDNDEAGRRHVQQVARSLHGKAESIRVVELPGLPEGGDITDWFALGGTYDTFTSILRETPLWTPERRPVLPEIMVNDRPLRDIARDALHALEVSNSPPWLFVRAGLLVRIQQDEKGRPIVQSLAFAHIRGYLTRAADFVVPGKQGLRHESPPDHVVADVLAMGGWPMPALENITETPVMRPDGTILGSPGYDSATRMFYAPTANLPFPAVSARPPPEDVAAALALLDEIFGDFPYVDEASHANMLGLLLTPILRPLIKGPTPLALIDAPQRGTGKSLLAELVSIVAVGRPAAMLSAPDNNEEWRKSLTSTFREAAAVITIDNVEGRLDAAALALALTAPVWKDRILGSSTTFEFPIACTWIATGNNISPGGDIPRRCFWVRLDAKMARPWQRTDFRHPNAREWAFEHRGALVAALLTLARNWFALDCPVADVPTMGSFESWSRTVGHVLAAAGVRGFLANLNEMYEQTDSSDSQWEIFLTEWKALYGDAPKRVAEVVSDLRSTVRRQMFEPNEQFLALREAIPDDVKVDVEGSEDSLKKRFGWALKRKLGVRHGATGIRIEKAVTEGYVRAERWRVVEDS